jgi:myosin protein heavy chain
MLYQKKNKNKDYSFLIKINFFSATLFAKSKNAMLAHLYIDVVEEEGSSKSGGKKKGGSMQTISATHRVSF